MPPLLTFIIPFLAVFIGTFCYNRGSSLLPSPVFQFLTSYDQFSIPPHYASWDTWFHPYRALSTGSARRKGWNIHHHLGGTGPWIEMIDDKEFKSGGIHPPEGCFIDQIHMVCSLRPVGMLPMQRSLTMLQIARHAERYLTTSAGDRRLRIFATSIIEDYLSKSPISLT